MKKIIAAFLLLGIATPAFADGTINTLGAGGALGGSELIPMFQTANPAVTTTPSALNTFLASTTQTLTHKTLDCTDATNTCIGPGTGSAGGQSPTGIGDNTTALSAGKYYYYTNANMTAPRSHNLPDSATQKIGTLRVCDDQRTVTSTNTLTLAAAGSDTLDGVTNGTQIIYAAGGCMEFENKGGGAYTTNFTNTTPNLTSTQIYVGNSSNRTAAASMSQDCSIGNTGVITCLKTNNVSFTALATTTPGANVATAAAVALSGNGGLTSTIASGAKALATGAIASAACTAAQTDTATNTATTDVVLASFNGDPTAVTGYIPLTTGMLTIVAYPTSGTVNFKVCNNTSSSITPGAITLNWRVVR